MELSGIRLYWYKSKNFGDALSPYLVGKISGEKPERSSHIATYLGLRENYAAVGSLFDQIGSKTTVWGSGIISLRRQIRRPKNILAVRGPLTRKTLIERGIECPEVYGDPSLLLPKYYSPKSVKKYELGIIPNYIDYRKVKRMSNDKRINVIDVKKPIEEVIEEIFSCKKTISSSLHGLIVSHVYNIPSVWAEFSNMVVGKGFKFRDYFQSVKLEEYEPADFRKGIPPLEELMKLFEGKKFKIKIDLKPLEECCPFKRSSKK